MFYADGFPFLSVPVRAIISKFSKDFDTSDSTKWKAALGANLNFDTVNAWTATGKRPNFINVDFYQGLEMGKSNLMTMVEVMNRSDILGSAQGARQYASVVTNTAQTWA